MATYIDKNVITKEVFDILQAGGRICLLPERPIKTGGFPEETSGPVHGKLQDSDGAWLDEDWLF